MNKKRFVLALTSAALAWQLSVGFAAAALIVDGGFRPVPNGFKFQNHGNTLTGPADAEGNPTSIPVTNLTTAEVVRLLGNQVCASGSGESCVLTKPAKDWMDKQNEGMNGGHCSGYSIMSALVYSGSVTVNQFGAATINELELQNNAPLQREIAYWAATQSLLPGGGMSEQNRDYTFVLDTLKAEFAKPVAERQMFEMGFTKRDGSAGHSVLPYAIDDLGNNQIAILLYDNNYPGKTMTMTLNTAAKTWKYTTAHDPSLAPSDYEGDATSNSLFLRNVARRLGQQNCPFCKETSGGGLNSADDIAPTSMQFVVVRSITPSSDGWSVTAAEDAHLAAALSQNQTDGKMVAFSITNSDNQTTGEVSDSNGNVSNVNQIPNASVLLNLTNRDDDTAPTFNVPDGRAYTLTVDGRPITRTQMLDFSTYDDDVFAALEDFEVAPGQVDTLNLDMNKTSRVYTMTHRTTDAGAPVLAIGVVSEGADYEVRARIGDNGNGQSMMMRLDNGAGTVALRSLDGTAETFEVQIDRVDGTAEITFHHAGISLPANATIYLHYGAWTARGQAMTATIDLNSDGSIDQTISLSDTFKMLLPLLGK